MIKITTETSTEIEQSTRYDALVAPTSLNGRCASPFAGYIHQQYDELNKLAMSAEYKPALGNFIYHKSPRHLLIRLPVVPVLLQPGMTNTYAQQAIEIMVQMLHTLRENGLRNVVIPNIKIDEKYIPFVFLLEHLVRHFANYDDFTVYVSSRNYNLENIPNWIEVIQGADPSVPNPTLSKRPETTAERSVPARQPSSSNPYAAFFRPPSSVAST